MYQQLHAHDKRHLNVNFLTPEFHHVRLCCDAGILFDDVQGVVAVYVNV